MLEDIRTWRALSPWLMRREGRQLSIPIQQHLAKAGASLLHVLTQNTANHTVGSGCAMQPFVGRLEPVQEQRPSRHQPWDETLSEAHLQALWWGWEDIQTKGWLRVSRTGCEDH